MTQPAVVRVLVRSDRIQDALHQLQDLQVGPSEVVVRVPEPGSYGDERPDLELRALVRAGAMRVVVGASIGAVVGGAIALLVPQLSALAPLSVWLVAFGGAWGCGAVAATRSLPVHHEHGSHSERSHEVDETSAKQLRVLTLRGGRERDRVVDVMAESGFIPLDSVRPSLVAEQPGEPPFASDVNPGIDPDIDLTGELAR